VKQGGLDGKAVVIIGTKPTSSPDVTSFSGPASPGGDNNKGSTTTNNNKSNSNNNKSNADAACSQRFPLIKPSTLGSSVFVYHSSAVRQLRSGVTGRFFDKLDNESGDKFSKEAFVAKVEELAAKHLTATLTYLAPANQVPIWQADYLYKAA
jgi:hypothetical protein